MGLDVCLLWWFSGSRFDLPPQMYGSTMIAEDIWNCNMCFEHTCKGLRWSLKIMIDRWMMLLSVHWFRHTYMRSVRIYTFIVSFLSFACWFAKPGCVVYPCINVRWVFYLFVMKVFFVLNCFRIYNLLVSVTLCIACNMEVIWASRRWDIGIYCVVFKKGN